MNSYTWDRANRLLSMGSVSYQYDGLGNRIQQKTGDLATRYLLDLQPGLAMILRAQEWDETDPGDPLLTDTVNYVHSPRGIHAQETMSGWEWMMQDGLGSVRGVVDNTVGVLESRNYDPYGELFDVTGTSQTSYGFTGEPTDDNGLLYLRNRYYNPAAGVFTALDPFEGIEDEPMSLNGYSWVEENTPNMVDPSGRIPTRDEIESGRIRYSCNCGWLDNDHISGGRGTAQFIENALRASIDYAALNAIDNTRVIYMPERSPNPIESPGGFLAIPFLTNFKVYVPESLAATPNAMTTIGLGIYMTFEETFESFQSVGNPIGNIAGRPSGFAEEDLVSDLLGYWIWLRYRDLNQSAFQLLNGCCKVMGFDQGIDKECALDMYDEYTKNGLSNAFSTQWTNWYRRPRPVEFNLTTRPGCECDSEQWPNEFTSLVSSAVRKAGDIDLTATITFNRPLPTNGWYELKDVRLNQYFKSVSGVAGLYVVEKAMRGC